MLDVICSAERSPHTHPRIAQIANTLYAITEYIKELTSNIFRKQPPPSHANVQVCPRSDSQSEAKTDSLSVVESKNQLEKKRVLQSSFDYSKSLLSGVVLSARISDRILEEIPLAKDEMKDVLIMAIALFIQIMNVVSNEKLNSWDHTELTSRMALAMSISMSTKYVMDAQPIGPMYVLSCFLKPGEADCSEESLRQQISNYEFIVLKRISLHRCYFNHKMWAHEVLPDIMSERITSSTLSTSVDDMILFFSFHLSQWIPEYCYSGECYIGPAIVLLSLECLNASGSSHQIPELRASIDSYKLASKMASDASASDTARTQEMLMAPQEKDKSWYIRATTQRNIKKAKINLDMRAHSITHSTSYRADFWYSVQLRICLVAIINTNVSAAAMLATVKTSSISEFSVPSAILLYLEEGWVAGSLAMSVCVESSSISLSLSDATMEDVSTSIYAKHHIFLASMKVRLHKQAYKLSACIGRCGRVHLVGSVYSDLIRNALDIMRVHANKLSEGFANDNSRFFVFVMKALSLDGAFHSLCDTFRFSPYEPLGDQNKEVWLICRALFELPLSCAQQACKRLCGEAPECVAMCGFLALMTRTPFALATFTHRCAEKQSFPIAWVASRHVEPLHARPLVSLVSRCVIGTNELFCSDVCACILAVEKEEAAYTGEKQLCVNAADINTEKRSFEEVSYSYQTDHCLEWMQLSMVARSRLHESSETPKQAQDWSMLWESVRHTAEMAYRVICRKQFIPFAVLWVHTRTGFVCFSRQLNVSGDYRQWIETCAKDLESSVRSSFETTKRQPIVPFSRKSKRYARDIHDREDRWNLECCDVVSEKSMSKVNHARLFHSSCFMMAQGSFRGVVSVCFVSCKL